MVRHPERPKSEKRHGDANWHSIPENRVCNGSQNQWFLGKNWSPMVVIVEKVVRKKRRDTSPASL
jgi:hypothetical protein